MRRAFANTLCALAEQDQRLIFLTGDLGFQVFDEFIKRFPSRYINAGIAEAQMVCAAAGLALEGYRPVVYSIASFMTARPFEQIRFCVAYSHLPVVVVGAGGGFTYSVSGVSHHAGDDLALMSLLPGMTVVAPGDPHEAELLLKQLLRIDGPSYLRIGKFGEPTFQAEAPPVLGQARLVCRGDRIAVLTTGDMVTEALRALEELRAENITPWLYQFHTIKPLDTGTLDLLAKQVEAVIIVEDALPAGGLGAAVTTWMSATLSHPRLVRLGPPDEFVLGNPTRDTMFLRYHYGCAAIAETCRRLSAKP